MGIWVLIDFCLHQFVFSETRVNPNLSLSKLLNDTSQDYVCHNFDNIHSPWTLKNQIPLAQNTLVANWVNFSVCWDSHTGFYLWVLLLHVLKCFIPMYFHDIYWYNTEFFNSKYCICRYLKLKEIKTSFRIWKFFFAHLFGHASKKATSL